MFTAAAIDAMRLHAAACYPTESCGFVIWGEYVPCENRHREPETQFRIADEAIRRYLDADVVEAVVHSHVAPAPPYPSYPDMQQQIAMRVPWAIVSVGADGRTDEPFYWGDDTRMTPLLGRPYRWGVTDCYAVIRDWYRAVKHKRLPAVARRWGYWAEAGATDLYLAHYEAAGFVDIGPPAADVGDTVLYRLPGRHAMHHAAVMVAPGTILHHPSTAPYAPNRLSLREPVSRYQQYITHVLRPTTSVAAI